jgi:hypothetical protein
MGKTNDKKITAPQSKSSVKRSTGHLAPWQWKKGQSGNPSGQKSKGESAKEYAKRRLANMTDKEKEDFFNGLNKSTIWEMAEGRPDTKGMLGIGADKESLAVLTEFFKGVANKKK